MTRTPWTLARRSFLLGAGLTALAACSSPAGVSCPTSARVVNRPVVPGTGGRPQRPRPMSTSARVVSRLVAPRPGVPCPTSAHVVTGARPGPGSTVRPVLPRLRPRLAVNRMGWRSVDRPW